MCFLQFTLFLCLLSRTNQFISYCFFLWIFFWEILFDLFLGTRTILNFRKSENGGQKITIDNGPPFARNTQNLLGKKRSQFRLLFRPLFTLTWWFTRANLNLEKSYRGIRSLYTQVNFPWFFHVGIISFFRWLRRIRPRSLFEFFCV